MLRKIRNLHKQCEIKQTRNEKRSEYYRRTFSSIVATPVMYFPQEISDGTVESRTIKRNFTMNVIQFVEMSLLDDEIGKETAEIDRTEKRGTYATTLRLLKTYSVHVTKFY